ncbi:MAG TPA: glutathionylspermidine synthase family protein [Candidatus Fimivivens sp.]|nr:glutathionylspermidine synthase family protein [Candidatus Fimivivens sp.]
MQRISVTPRSDWKKIVESQGLLFHHDPQGNQYWDEGAYYRFTGRQIDVLEDATNKVQALCLEAVQFVIDHDRFADLCIPEEAAEVIMDAWEQEPPAIYGRFDFAYDGINPPKLLEYNADTPTSLLEASVIQWFWLQSVFPEADQFNSIHERLVAKWKELKKYLIPRGPLYFMHLDEMEDLMTVSYLRETAQQAGIPTKGLLLGDVGWNGSEFVDLEGYRIRSAFKLYPWEWILGEDFGPQVLSEYRSMQWIEPIWKMLLSNKGILPILWELNGGHENLLEAYADGPRGMDEYVRKPLLSREGANVKVVSSATVQESGGDYGEEGYIYQKYFNVPSFEGNRPILGCWVIDGEAAGMGIRETRGLITDNMARFIPHIFFNSLLL